MRLGALVKPYALFCSGTCGAAKVNKRVRISVAVNAFRRQPLIVNVHARHSKITALCILLWMRITRSPPRLMQKKTIILLLCMYGLPRYRGPQGYRPSQTI